MSIQELTKEQIITILQETEYYRDGLFEALMNIALTLKISTLNCANDDEVIFTVSKGFNNFYNNLTDFDK
jgi:hypothetical protein